MDLPYNHSAVRDLAWIMKSPGLLAQTALEGRLVSDSLCNEIYTACTDRLNALDQDPAPLEDWLSGRQSHRLGAYFETLLQFWLIHLLDVKSVWHNLPVYSQAQGSRRTLGEFDLLFQMPGEERFQHWEVAVKYYLGFKGVTGEVKWIGPGARDRLDRKLQHLATHQLPLASSPEGLAVLHSAGIQDIDSRALVKGYLYTPLGDSRGDDPLAEMISPSHLGGWWTSQPDTILEQADHDLVWTVLPRLRWLSPFRVNHPPEGKLLNRQSLPGFCQAHFASGRQPLHLVALKPSRQGFEESNRGFVVADNWPEIAEKP